MRAILKGAKILITGGAGSVGHALTKQMLKYSPRVIRIYDISENEMAELKSEFSREFRLRYLIGDIRDECRLKLAMEGIDIVIHLAAMKHVYACEYNPFEAIKINVDGLQNVINVARDANVKKMIFSSTDKAAHPSNVMGITKLLGERLISLANNYRVNKRTLFSSVRFGNVIGSNGSVIPLFRRQISSGGPLTITEREMTRFVITMEEAINLIFQVIKLTKGGEVFVSKMRTAKVVDIAEAMIRKYGSSRRIRILFKGKCEGEKFHEEIMSDDELIRAKDLGKLYVIFPEADHFHIADKDKEARPIKDPIIKSNMGRHVSQREIMKLLDGTVEV